jgi:hypothetical protein
MWNPCKLKRLKRPSEIWRVKSNSSNGVWSRKIKERQKLNKYKSNKKKLSTIKK